MPGIPPHRDGAPRLRRARRADIAALLDQVGGPPGTRLRALSRILKTLVADVYVIDEGGALRGVVAVTYRRSLAHGGLVATIDLLRALTGEGVCEESRSALTAQLVECALFRARRRGCVAIDASAADPDSAQALERAGFAPVAAVRVCSLRSAAPACAESNDPERRGDA